jgi:hypothetical protein
VQSIKRALYLIILALCSIIAIDRPAWTAEIKALPWFENDWAIAITGPIVRGDDERFRNVALDVIKKGHYIRDVRIYSHGGLTDAALAIGRQIRVLGSITTAPKIIQGQLACIYNAADVPHVSNGPSCACESACSLIWMAGTGRDGQIVGLHRPRYDEIYYRELSPEAAEEQYKVAEDQIRDYLAEMGVPSWTFQVMFQTPSKGMHYLTDSELLAFSNADPALDELVVARCGKTIPGGTIFDNPVRKKSFECYVAVINDDLGKGRKAYLQQYGRGSNISKEISPPQVPQRTKEQERGDDSSKLFEHGASTSPNR